MSGSAAEAPAVGNFSAAPRLALLYAALFWVMCLGVVYLPEWLGRIGLDTAQIGLVLAVAAWLKVPLTLFAGNIADQSGRRKKVLLIAVALMTATVPVLFYVRDFFWVCVAWACVGALASTCVPLADSISVTAVRRERAQYGRMRMWGSISFLTASVTCGWLISSFAAESTVIWLLLAGAVSLLLCASRLPDYRTRPPLQTGFTLLPVLKLPGLALFLAVAATLMASHAALYSLSTIYWTTLGIPLSTVGLLWATGVIAEIGIFFISRRLQLMLSPWRMLAIAGAVGVCRWSLTAIVSDATQLFFIQSLHAITFTFTQLAVISCIARQVPEELTSSAQSIYDSCAIGIVFGVALIVSGLLSKIDMALSFWAMAVMSASAAIIAIVVSLRGDSNFPAAKQS